MSHGNWGGTRYSATIITSNRDTYKTPHTQIGAHFLVKAMGRARVANDTQRQQGIMYNRITAFIKRSSAVLECCRVAGFEMIALRHYSPAGCILNRNTSYNSTTLLDLLSPTPTIRSHRVKEKSGCASFEYSVVLPLLIPWGEGFTVYYLSYYEEILRTLYVKLISRYGALSLSALLFCAPSWMQQNFM